MMLSQQQFAVLKLVWMYQPITDVALEEKAKAQGLKFSPSGLRTRRSELVGKGLVESGGKTRVRGVDRPCNMWKTTNVGDQHIQAERGK